MNRTKKIRSHGRRIGALEMCKYMLRDAQIVTPQAKAQLSDILFAHYGNDMTRGEVNRMITRVLRANGQRMEM